MLTYRWLLAFILCLFLGVLATWALGFRGAHGPEAPNDLLAVPGAVHFGFVDLEHGSTGLYPLEPGRVARVAVKENDRVPAGAPLLYLDEEAARIRIEEARAAADAAEAQLAQAHTAAEQHGPRLALQEAACDAAKSRLSAAQHLLERKKDLEKNKLIDAREVAAAADEVKALEALSRVEQKKLVELRLHDPRQVVRRAEAETAVARARLKQAERSLTECILKAPQAGTVVRILVTPGEVLGPQPRQPAIVFAPAEPRVVRAEIEQESAAGVAVGQEAWVSDDISARAIGKGHVVRLSDWYLPRRAVFLEPARVNAGRTLECIIALDPGHPPVRLGQRVRVTLGPASP